MPRSPLRGFNRRSVDELVDLGVHIVYDHSLIKSPWLGLWYPSYDLICINPEVKEEKSQVIVHEGLHAYEELILDVIHRFRESQIDWWAWHHLKRDPGIADYMLKGLLVPH